MVKGRFFLLFYISVFPGKEDTTIQLYFYFHFQMTASQMIRDIQSRICINLDKDDARYSAGDVIKGAVVINFPQEITVKGKFWFFCRYLTGNKVLKADE